MIVPQTQIGNGILPVTEQSKIVLKQNKFSLRIGFLQSYISSTFTGCGLPPINQFIQSPIIDDHIQLRLDPGRNMMVQEDDQCIYYVYCGKVFLKKRQEHVEEEDIRKTEGHRSPGLVNKQKKMIEIRENCFFTLLNYKKILDENPERYAVGKIQISNSRKKCLVGKIKINKNYGEEWYRHESQKYSILTKAFYQEKNEISQYKMKGLSRFFKHQSYRRGTCIIREDQPNTKLIVVKSGQCQYSKNLYHEENSQITQKQVKLANGGPLSVFGCQFLLFGYSGSSKPIVAVAKVLQDDDSEISYMKVSDKSIHNFTVSVTSAFAQFYYIAVPKFKQICDKYVRDAPKNLRNNIQNGYITLFRTMKEKKELQNIKLQRNQKKRKEERTLFEARIQTGQYQTQKLTKEQTEDLFYRTHSNLQVRKSELEQTHMKEGFVENKRTKKLQKKIDLILQNKKQDLDYKKKIQNLLRQKIKRKNQEEQQMTDPTPLQVSEGKKIVEDLEEIFMNDDNGRTQSIQRQNEILRKKEQLLKKRYKSFDNVLIVHEEFYDKKKNKAFKIDLLKKGYVDPELKNTGKGHRRSLDMNIYSAKIKSQYLQKINKANKIKEQFMKIRSQCENCHCYDNIETINEENGLRDVKRQTMKVGSAWKVSQRKSVPLEQPLEKLHLRTKFLNQKSASKYEHNKHLQMKKKGITVNSKRKLSAPLIM